MKKDKILPKPGARSGPKHMLHLSNRNMLDRMLVKSVNNTTETALPHNLVGTTMKSVAGSRESRKSGQITLNANKVKEKSVADQQSQNSD